jgi:hypothetical protein
MAYKTAGRQSITLPAGHSFPRCVTEPQCIGGSGARLAIAGARLGVPCDRSRAVDHAALPLDAAAAEGCVKVALTILGEPASKANQRQLVSFPTARAASARR